MGLVEREDQFSRISKIDKVDDMMVELKAEVGERGVNASLMRRALEDQFEKLR
jgi:hypothetical protein